MTWTKLGEDYADRPAMIRLPRGVRHMHTEALIWCNRFGTDGAIPSAALTRLTDERDAESGAAQLVAAGLWKVTEDGWEIIDFKKDQPSAEDVERVAALARERQRRQRQHRNGDHSLCDPQYCRVTRDATRDERGESRASHNTRSDRSDRSEGTREVSVEGARSNRPPKRPAAAPGKNWRRLPGEAECYEVVMGGGG